MKLIHKGLILISLPLVFEIFFAIRFVDLLHHSKQLIDREIHAKEITRSVEKIQALLAESTTIAGLSRVYKNKVYVERYDMVWKEITADFRALKNLAHKEERADFPEIAKLLRYIRFGQAFIATAPEAENYQNLSTAGLARDIPSWLMAWRNGEPTYSPFDRLIALEAKTINTGAALRTQITEQLQRFLLIGVLGNLAIVLGLALFFWQSIAKRLANLMKNTVLLRKKEDLLPPLGGSDEIAELDSALHNTASKILEMEKFKKQLVSAISHEIKAPLSAVNSLLTMISTKVYGELPQEAALIVSKAEKDSQNLVRLVMNLLNLERMESKLKISPTSVDAIIKKVLDLTEQTADSRGITVITKSFPEIIRVDADQITQALSDLLSSVLETAEKDSLVELEATHDSNSFRFNILYSGQEINASSGAITSTSLAISESIAKLHGGRLVFQTTTTKNSLYSLQIPDDFAKAEQPEPPVSPFEQRRNWGIWQKGLLLICLPFLFELIFMSALSALLLQAGQEVNQQEQSREVVDTVYKINERSWHALLFMAVDIGFHDKRIRDAYDSELHELDTNLNKLLSLSGDDKNRLKLAAKITGATRELTAEYTSARETTENKDNTLSGLFAGPEASHMLFKKRKILSSALDSLTAYEGARRIQFEQNATTIERNLNQVLLGGLAVNLLIALSLTVLLVKGITKRIANVMDNARRLSSRTPLLPAMEPTDEIGELDAAFHQAANDLREQQEQKDKLISIVSGELQEPLKNIQNSLQTLQSGSIGSLSSKAGEKIALAEQGIARLIKLIGDLLDIESDKFRMPVAKKTDS